MQSINRFIPSLCCGIAYLLMSSTIYADEFENARVFWRSMDDIKHGHSVEFKQIAGGKIHEYGTYLRQNSFALITGTIRGQNFARIANPEYSAALAQNAKEPWRIRWLGNDNSVIKEESNSEFSDMFFVHVLDPCSVASVLNDNRLASNLQMLPNQEGYSFTINSALPAQVSVHPAYTGANVRVYGPVDRFPTRCEIIQTKQHGGLGTRLDYESFVDVKGISLPTLVNASFIQKFGESGTSPARYQYDYSKINDRVDTKQCYLTHYGLPEPGKKSTNNLLFEWVFFSLGLILFFVALFVVWKKYNARS